MNVQYRVWDKRASEFIKYPTYISTDGRIIRYQKDDEIFAYRSKEFGLQQYTDTHDKNGLRVCEGDVLHIIRQITHVDPEFKEEWRVADDKHKAYMLEHKLVMIADYEEIGIVKKNPTRWALSPYLAKTVSFEHSKVTEKWIEASKSRPLRVNRGLWIVEVIGNIYETPDLYTEAQKST